MFEEGLSAEELEATLDDFVDVPEKVSKLHIQYASGGTLCIKWDAP